jgi:hypothetical protein
MGARLRAHLTLEEDRTLFELRQGPSVPQRVKDRAEAVRLSHQGWYVEKIATFLRWHPQTVREALHRWQQGGLGGLGSGRSGSKAALAGSGYGVFRNLSAGRAAEL